MKTRESGMPEESQWESYFDPSATLERLQLRHGIGDVVEFGCGYGTFTLPAAMRSTGTIHAIDIEPELVDLVVHRARIAGLENVSAAVRDFVAEGTGLVASIADYAMLFNILHAEQPHILLSEAWRVLRPGGLLGIIHWNHDALTPRGPSMEIRPRPQQCVNWAIDSGFELRSEPIDLPPYHYGFVMSKASPIVTAVRLDG